MASRYSRSSSRTMSGQPRSRTGRRSTPSIITAAAPNGSRAARATTIHPTWPSPWGWSRITRAPTNSAASCGARNARAGCSIRSILSQSSGTDPGRTTCFCEFCRKRGRDLGIDVERARRGFGEIEKFVRASRAGERPRDGFFTNTWRLLLAYPEVLAWANLWVSSRHDFQAAIYRKVKSINPALPVGWHVWHKLSFSPFQRAEENFAAMTAYADFLRPALYNNVAGSRFVSFVNGVRPQRVRRPAAGGDARGALSAAATTAGRRRTTASPRRGCRRIMSRARRGARWTAWPDCHADLARHRHRRARGRWRESLHAGKHPGGRQGGVPWRRPGHHSLAKLHGDEARESGRRRSRAAGTRPALTAAPPGGPHFGLAHFCSPSRPGRPGRTPSGRRPPLPDCRFAFATAAWLRRWGPENRNSKGGDSSWH